MMDRDALLGDLRRQLAELRLRTGIRRGDELDFALVAVEGLAATMTAIATDASRLIEEGHRTIGALISAAMTRQVLWRLCVLPAAIAALMAAALFAASFSFLSLHTAAIIAADRAAMSQEFDAQRSAFETYRAEVQADLDKARAKVEAEREQVEKRLPGLLIARATELTGVAKGLLQTEAGAPGFVDWLAKFYHDAKRITDTNGSLCPRTYYQGDTLMCTYMKPSGTN